MVSERLHYRGQGQPDRSPAAYLHTCGNDDVEGRGLRVVPPAGPPRIASGAAHTLLRVLLTARGRREERGEASKGKGDP